MPVVFFNQTMIVNTTVLPLAYTNSQYMNSHDNGSLVLEWWNFAGKIFSQWKEKKRNHIGPQIPPPKQICLRGQEKKNQVELQYTQFEMTIGSLHRCLFINFNYG